MKHEHDRRTTPRNLVIPRTELVYLPVTPEVARAVEQAMQTTLAGTLTPPDVPPQKRSAAGRAILHARGVSLPGVLGMNRGVRRYRRPLEEPVVQMPERETIGTNEPTNSAGIQLTPAQTVPQGAVAQETAMLTVRQTQEIPACEK